MQQFGPTAFGDETRQVTLQTTSMDATGPTLDLASDRPPETDSGCFYPPSGVVCAGIYAGRRGDMVKIGQSLNLRQRVDTLALDELLAVLPVHVSRQQGEGEQAYITRVRDAVQTIEHRIQTAIADLRIVQLSRANANEWFRFDGRILEVLHEAGAILATRRIPGRILRTRPARFGWPIDGVGR